MVWVKFTAFFNWRVGQSGRSVDYQAGEVKNVTTACATRAIDTGRAVRMRKESKFSEPVEVDGDGHA